LQFCSRVRIINLTNSEEFVPQNSDPKMNAKPAKSSLLVRIDGQGITPATMRASDLADFITNLEVAITEAAIEKGDLDPELPSDEAEVSLVSIGEGSNRLGVALAPSVVPSTNRVLRSVASRETSSINQKCFNSLKKIHSQSVDRAWRITFQSQGDPALDFGEVVISEAIPFPEKKVRTTKGGTTIYGKLMRFGNARPTASVVLDDKSRVSVEMSRQMVKDLESRHRLFDRVGFEGIATWSIPDWKIVDFEATRIVGFRSTGDHLTKMFDELGRLANGRWDDVDAVEYVNKIRGKEER